ncbi:16S rRNA (cytosine(1402)-N(4))-methyltransferase [Psittacicella hinzii]|uniref:Ribosomal RNA small subunit methyltransferase H n=1 Tax=Psittacicella hinzii TaxID=2028575 RepID=A0A3A1Y9A7_9GAMM|nr:16S rRNA (cytosine(1402)-N(4))-methyltransferase RsmH [Psittacicella hinzii]RIY34131.1 16S rRNA (cytosine(1402)-N(4))-methyltransferase [Psittacicella hinzii]
MQEFKHTTVMLNEAVALLEIKEDGFYVDGTFGRGGHSSLILKHLGENGRLYVFDRDIEAIKHAQTLNDPRIVIVHSPFSNMGEYFTQNNLLGKIDGILLDLGVSSPQIDNAERGFSFMHNGPLDMRMDQSSGLSAREWLYQTSEKEIADALFLYGQEKNSRSIARAIVQLRESTEFSDFLPDTDALVKLVKGASKKVDKNKNPATRTFQAIRIAINNELDELKTALNDSLKILSPQGKLSIISFHSLEDGIVKHFFKQYSTSESLPKFLPIADTDLEGNEPYFSHTTKAIKPSEEEIAVNTRSRSAILRGATRSSKPFNGL